MEMQLTIELWYTEHGVGLASGVSGTSGANSHATSNGSTTASITGGNGSGGATSGANIECVSTRILNLNLKPTKGLHYHLPVLFDYFHLSAVSMTIHAVLISLHQPYIK